MAVKESEEVAVELSTLPLEEIEVPIGLAQTPPLSVPPLGEVSGPH